MSSLLRPAPASARRPRLGLVRLEDRAVPAAFIADIDPAVDMAGAIDQIAGFIDKANNSPDEPDSIDLFPGGVYVFTAAATGNTALPTIRPTSTKASSQGFFILNGNGATLKRADNAPDMRLLTIAGTTDKYGRAEIRNLRLEGGRLQAGVGGGSGGAVAVQTCPVSFIDCQFVNNRAVIPNSQTGHGGAVSFSTDKGLTATWENVFTRCLFENNVAAQDGGAVNISGESAGTLGLSNTIQYTFQESQFTNNKSLQGNGGAISSITDNFTIDGCSFVNNSTTGPDNTRPLTFVPFGAANPINSAVPVGLGGAVSVIGYDPPDRVDAVIRTSTFVGNSARRGGAVAVTTVPNPSLALDVNLLVTNSTFTGNTAKLDFGGGLEELPNAANFRDEVLVNLNYNIIANNTNETAGSKNGELLGRFSSTAGFNLLVTPPDPATFVSSSGSNTTIFGDPNLGPLQNNGGFTLSRIPQPGSPALNATGLVTPPTGVPNDQRGIGFGRVVFPSLDIGAVEVQPAGAVALVIEQGDNQVTANRAAFTTPLVVRAIDRFGAAVPNRELTTSEIVAGAGATFPLGTTVVTDGNGRATFYPVANKTTGGFVQLVRTGETVATFRLYNRGRLNFIDNNNVLDPITLPDSGNLEAAVVDTTYAKPLKVQVTELNPATGNFDPVVGATVSFLVTSTGGDPNRPGVVFESGAVAAGGYYTRTTTDAQGFAQVQAKANTKAGQVTVLASVGGPDPDGNPLAAAAATFTLTNQSGAISTVRFLLNDDAAGKASGGGQQALVPNVFDRPLVALVGDVFGNPANGVAVTFANADPANPAKALFFQNDPTNPALSKFQDTATVTTGKDGLATVVARAGTVAGTYTVRATAAFENAGVPGTATLDYRLTNLSGLPASVTPISGGGQSALVVAPGTGGGVGAFAQPLVVEVRDAGGNLVANTPVSFQGPGVGPSASFLPTTLSTDAQGRARVTAVPNNVAGVYAVRAVVQTGSNPATFAEAGFTLTNSSGQPARVVLVSGGDQSAQVNTAYADPILVRILDQFDNPVPGVVPAVASGGGTFTATPANNLGESRITGTAGGGVGAISVTVTAGGQTVIVPLAVTAEPFGPPQPLNGVPALTAVGLGGGIASRVTVYNPDGSARTQFAPYDPGFLGGARVAVARAPLPAAPTVVVVPGPGRFPDARVFNADTGTLQGEFQPFEATFTGGVFVATADLDRDGWDDYVFSPDQGGGPRVQIRSGQTGRVLLDFFGIDDPAFRGGARTAIGDVNGDTVPDLIVSAGFGGGPRVAVYDGTTLLGLRPTPVKIVGDFFAFEPTLRNGVYLAAGDVTGDGAADLVLGGGPGGGPRVRVIDGRALASTGGQSVVTDFFAGPITDRGGVTVAVRDLDADAKNDLVTASGSGDGSRVNVYLGRDVRVGQLAAARGFDELGGFRGGVFVG